MQIQISWFLKKPTDLNLYCLQRQGISRFSKTLSVLDYFLNIHIVVACTNATGKRSVLYIAFLI